MSTTTHKMLPPKSKQTYQEALDAIRDEKACPRAMLNDIAKRHMTSELLIEALLHDRAALRHIPPEKRTYEMCYIAVERDPYAIIVTPEEFLDMKLVHHAVNAYGEALQPALYRYRKVQGREKEAYNGDDIRLMLAAVCPIDGAERRLREYINPDHEMRGRTLEEFASDECGVTRSIPARVIAQGLRALLSAIEADI